MARLYQKINGEAVPLGGGGGGSVAIDNETITKNSDDEIQVATALTGKINQLDNVASDAGKVLTANGDGTADWENGYVEGFYGTTAEWDALTYAQKQAWVQKNPKVTFTDDYVSNIKQDVAGCISSTNENDVAGASALKEALTYSTTVHTYLVHATLGDTLFTRIGNICYLGFSSAANSISSGWNYGVVPYSQIPEGYRPTNPVAILSQVGMSNSVILQAMIDHTNGFSVYNPSGAVQYASVFIQYVAEEDLPIS